MTKSRKIELLYQKAKGIQLDLSKAELRELKKYKVECGEDSFYATKSNIKAYVDAVDIDGCRSPFYDWCMNNKKADRRRKGSSEQEMEITNKTNKIAAMLGGWLTWGIAVYWFLRRLAPTEIIPTETCALYGGIIAAILYVQNRAKIGWRLFLLPILLAIFFYGE